MYSQLILIAIVIIGFVLLFFPDYLLPKESQNMLLLKVREYHQFFGILFIGIAYYFYMAGEKTTLPTTEPTTISETAVTPPSYEEATSESFSK